MNLRHLWLPFFIILFTGAGLFTRNRSSEQFHQKLVNDIQRNLSTEFEKIDEEAAALLADHVSASSPAWDVDHFFIFVDSGKVVGWNQSHYLPDLSALPAGDSISFAKTLRGEYLIRRWSVSESSFLACVLMLTERYPVANNFLSPQWNPAIFPSRDIGVVSPQALTGDDVRLGGKIVFGILPEKSEVHESTMSFLLLSAALLSILAGLWRIKTLVEERAGFDLAFVWLFAGLLLTRLAMIAVNFPSLYFSSNLFDPKKFASSSLNASLGDLGFNATVILVLTGYLFFHFPKFRFNRWLLGLTGISQKIASAACLLACTYALMFPFDFIEVIYHNSTLSLDISQSLSFDMSRIVALASVMTGCVSSFLFIHVFFSVGSRLAGGKMLFFLLLLVSLFLFALQSYLSGRSLWITLTLGFVFFSVLRLAGISGTVFKASFQLFIYLVFSLFIFSFQNAWAARLFYNERQLRDQFRFGKDFLTERDVLGEYLLDQARQRIQNDQFIRFRTASLFLSKTAVVDKIRRVHLNNYFDRYEVRITASSNEDPSGKSVVSPADSVETQLLKDFSTTDYPGIFYASSINGGPVKRYYVTIPIFNQRPVGSILLDLSLKRVIPDNVYPELLVDNRFNQIYRNKDFSYGVYTRGKLVSSFGVFNYDRDFLADMLGNPALYDRGVTFKKYSHIAIEDPDGSVDIVSASRYSLFYFVTNFSFWFALGLIFLFVGQGAFGIYSYIKGKQINYSARIQLFIFLSFLLPLVAVSITTLTLMGRSSEESIQKDFLNRSMGISQRIAAIFSGDSVKTRQMADLESWIEENTTAAKIDVSVYAPDGKLMATSQPALFDDQLISTLIDRGAWKKIRLQRETQTVSNEQIGNLQYSCAYSAVLSPETGKLEAIVGLPFFESAAFIQKSQTLILSNILIVFVVVFILFSLLSFWAASYLTFPIRFITKALGQTTLTGQNKLVQWNSSDEIGTMVKEYNRMVENLDDSRKALARSEKESAWREMAKQVAHEIKNPLTPMKLTLQQMEQALKSGNLPAEKSQKSVEVLLKQVEILNEIAASFSTFARLPAPSPQTVDLRTLLQGTANLFAAEKEGRVTYMMPDEPIIVSLDPTSFSRAASNIVINAIQARKPGQEFVEVEIKSLVAGGKALISIRDNAKGMSQQVQERVFQPQFTTKQSGSGLGLAMARQMVTQASGRIWFESEMDRGTVFYIELPLEIP